MAVTGAWVFVVAMDVAPEKEALFHEVYDAEHVPHLLEVPGVRSVRRGEAEAFAIAIGGGVEDRPQAQPRFVAIYEIDDPDVLKSAAWAAAVERGRWPTEVRPFTTNRHHALYRLR